MDTLLTRLKAETRSQHQQTETLLYASELRSCTLSREAYGHLLAIHYVFHQALETAVAAQTDFFAGYDAEVRRKTPWLAADLTYMHVPLPLPDPHLFANWNGYQLLGALYVAEGSMLGGQLIAGILRKTPALSDIATSQFFGGYGEQTGPLWRAFGTYLTARANGHDRVIVQAADSAFGYFQHLAGAPLGIPSVFNQVSSTGFALQPTQPTSSLWP